MRTPVYILLAVLGLVASFFDHSKLVPSLLVGVVFAMVYGMVERIPAIKNEFMMTKDPVFMAFLGVMAVLIIPSVAICLGLGMILAMAKMLGGTMVVMFSLLAAREVYYDCKDVKYARFSSN